MKILQFLLLNNTQSEGKDIDRQTICLEEQKQTDREGV